MTMIELSIVMAIVTVLLALVLGLSRHVNAIVKVRRAQADLGEWHEALNRWYLQFGEYPYEAIDVATGKPLQTDLIEPDNPTLNFSNILARCFLRFSVSGSATNVFFRTFATSGASHIDPWGSPYIYYCDEGKKSYILYSCGPDSRSVLHGKPIPKGGSSAPPDPTLDDIYLER